MRKSIIASKSQICYKVNWVRQCAEFSIRQNKATFSQFVSLHLPFQTREKCHMPTSSTHDTLFRTKRKRKERSCQTHPAQQTPTFARKSKKGNTLPTSLFSLIASFSLYVRKPDSLLFASLLSGRLSSNVRSGKHETFEHSSTRSLI